MPCYHDVAVGGIEGGNLSDEEGEVVGGGFSSTKVVWMKRCLDSPVGW